MSILYSAIATLTPADDMKRVITKLPKCNGRLILISVGEAAWDMAATVTKLLGEKVSRGIVITGYHGAKGTLEGLMVFEANRSVPDANSFYATQAAVELCENLCEEDLVLFLLSPGTESLFELPMIDKKEFLQIRRLLFSCEMTEAERAVILTRLSKVKGGRFSNLCAPAQVRAIVLTDYCEGPLSMAGAGIAFPETSTSKEAYALVKKYDLALSDDAMDCLLCEVPKSILNVKCYQLSSIRELCEKAAKQAKELGYESIILTDRLTCTSAEAGRFLALAAHYRQKLTHSTALIAGGRTVSSEESGMNGRNRELIIAFADHMEGFKDTAVLSVSSSGIDGDTNAAGGYCDCSIRDKILESKLSHQKSSRHVNSYELLKKVGGLVITTPTKTNVGDLCVVLIQREK